MSVCLWSKNVKKEHALGAISLVGIAVDGPLQDNSYRSYVLSPLSDRARTKAYTHTDRADNPTHVISCLNVFGRTHKHQVTNISSSFSKQMHRNNLSNKNTLVNAIWRTHNRKG